MPTMTLCMAHGGRTPAIALSAVQMGQGQGRGQEQEQEQEQEQGLVVLTEQVVPRRMVVQAMPPATQAGMVAEGSLLRGVDAAAGESEK